MLRGKCTLETTNDFIKSVGLYSECSALAEPLTLYFLDGPDLSDEYYKDLFRDLQILGKIAPLIEANVLLLGNPRHGYCADCADRTEGLLDDATKSILSGHYHRQVELVSTPRGFQLGLQIPELQPDHSHPVTTYIPITKSEAALLRRMGPSGKSSSKAGHKVPENLIGKTVKFELSSLFFELEMSRGFGSLLLSGSRAETLVIATLDKEAPGLAEIEDWEKLRTVHLPWVHFLTAEEILMLRQEAGKALPRLRELLRIRLSEPPDGTSSLLQTVAELRAQALEVQAELDGLNLPRERNYRAGMVGLAMAFVVYGLASQSSPVVATSVSALLATLAHLRNAEREHDSKIAKAVSTPGYALLKAKEILSHR